MRAPALAAVFMAASAFAQAPATVSYQGRLLNADGSVASGLLDYGVFEQDAPLHEQFAGFNGYSARTSFDSCPRFISGTRTLE